MHGHPRPDNAANYLVVLLLDFSTRQVFAHGLDALVGAPLFESIPADWTHQFRPVLPVAAAASVD